MARSSYIYLLIESGSGDILGAFTVKHEMETFRKGWPTPAYVVRHRDGQPGTGTELL